MVYNDLDVYIKLMHHPGTAKVDEIASQYIIKVMSKFVTTFHGTLPYQDVAIQLIPTYILTIYLERKRMCIQ
jgi:hypothetical protein